MALFNWDASYSVGVAEIDQQHKQLVDTLNQLHQGIVHHHSSAETASLLKTLLECTHAHFAHEEHLFSCSQYPDVAAHKAAHNELNQKVTDCILRFNDAEIALDVNLLDFLSDWLMEHILHTDKQYTPWLHKAGIH